MLIVTRMGERSLATGAAYEVVLRQELVQLQLPGKPRGLIVDIDATRPQERDVAWALRRMEARLGDLRPERIAVVSSFGASRPHARHLKQPDTQVFGSMKYAREWIVRMADQTETFTEGHDLPCDADPEGMAVRVYGPADTDVMMTPSAALGRCADVSLANCRLQAQTPGGRQAYH